jgi:ATP-binding cassette, subfamily B, bacterial
MKRLFHYCREFKSYLNQGSLFSFLNKFFDLAPPLLIGMAVDVVIDPSKGYFVPYGFVTMMEQLYLLAFLTIVVWVLESVFEYLYQLRWKNLAQKIQHKLRMDTYSKVQKLEMSYFENQSTGTLVATLNDDVNQLERFLGHGFNDLIQVMSTVVIVGGVFFYISPLIASVSFVPIPFILWGSFYFQKKIQPRYAIVRGEAGLLSSIISNNLNGMSSVKSYLAEKFETKLLEKQSLAYQTANRDAIKLASSFSPLIRMVVLSGFIAAMIIGGYQVSDGILGVGAYSVLVNMTQRLLWPLTRLGETFDLLQRAMASGDRVFKLLDTEIKVVEGKKELELAELKGQIKFSSVNFSYEGRDPILKELNLEVKPGQTIGLVGATGAGKSTIAKILLRFYDLDKGKVELDGIDIKDLTFETLRSAFSYVGQDNYLFHGSVFENIRYGSFFKSLEEVKEAARLAEADEFISNLNQGYDTIVGERGQKLSGGQRQRISIARAILKDAPIFLFDEATSAVDNETEAAIARSLKRITAKKTTILIAHRLSTIVHADVIYVLDKGLIKESGTHEELLALKGTYYSLWALQTGESKDYLS